MMKKWDMAEYQTIYDIPSKAGCISKMDVFFTIQACSHGHKFQIANIVMDTVNINWWAGYVLQHICYTLKNVTLSINKKHRNRHITSVIISSSMYI